MVGPGRLELPTSRLSGVRSNHLSYGPLPAAVIDYIAHGRTAAYAAGLRGRAASAATATWPCQALGLDPFSLQTLSWKKEHGAKHRKRDCASGLVARPVRSQPEGRPA